MSASTLQQLRAVSQPCTAAPQRPSSSMAAPRPRLPGPRSAATPARRALTAAAAPPTAAALTQQPSSPNNQQQQQQISSQLSHAPAMSRLLAVAGGDGALTSADAADAPSSASSSKIGTLLIKCPDARGVVASVAQLLYGFGCNIVSSDQFSDLEQGMFYQRVQFDYSGLLVGPGNAAVLERGIAEVAARYSMEWQVAYQAQQKRVALLVSKLSHGMYDLLIRKEEGELNCQIPIIISNHKDLEHIAKRFDVPFVHLPISKDTKAQQEAQIERLLEEHQIDLVVLARYMQIFSPEFCERHWRHTINIHHSFLPAFEGARPYHRAHARGVKVIGATAHYATSELDCGPIIDQDVARVTHQDSVADMIRKGRDLERLVLARAVRWHLQDRVIVHDNKTVVFEG